MKAIAKTNTSPTITVDPRRQRIHPAGRVHAPKKSEHGLVNFHAASACTLVFRNPKVFGHGSARLAPGVNKRAIQVERGRTVVYLKGCEDRIPRSLGAAGSPTEIVVP